MTEEVRVIVLERGEHRESIIHTFQKGWCVRFVRGPSLLGSSVSLTTTLSGSDPLPWLDPEDQLKARVEVVCKKAGAYKYELTVDGDTVPCGSGHFIVHPSITCNGDTLPLDAIVCQTHIVKLLGPLSEWESRLRIMKESGYNMLHLTPVHQLGVSNSAYSIKDHSALNDTLNTKSFDDLSAFVNKIEKEWGIVTVEDVVWNHAAKNAQWLMDHPECAYNCLNSPHLRPAYVIDRAYHHFGKEIAEGKWEHRGVPACIDNIHHIHSIEYLIRTELLPKLRLHEFFQCDVEKHVKAFIDGITDGPTRDPLDNEVLTLEVDPEWRRFGRTVDGEKALRIFNRFRQDSSSEEDRVWKAATDLRGHLEHINNEASKEAWDICMGGLNAVIGHITYERVADHGPRKGFVTEKEPLLCDYFLHLEPSTSWEEDEKLAYSKEKSPFLMAFNGWVMSDNPLQNFALADSQVYLRRELVCWGDSVKLNYGEKPEDCPFLWDYMRKYTETCTKIFKGLRIDNAHGTPIHVAEYLLKCARDIRPDLYAFAELFTGSEYLDNVFVNRLGITSLIREAQSAHDSHEQGRLVYKYGGDCVGAMKQKRVQTARECVAHAMFLDQSHDNPTPIQTRSAWDLLPTAAMASMASCAVGSTRGYDELVRHAIHVVSEERLYGRWEKEVTAESGILKARKVLNDLHVELSKGGFNQIFVDQMSPSVVGITRHNPHTHDTVVVVSHTVFDKNDVRRDGPGELKWIPIGGVLQEILFELEVEQTSDSSAEEDPAHLVGLSNFRAVVREHVEFGDSKHCIVHEPKGGHIQLTRFPAGAVVGFRIRLDDNARKAADFCNDLIEGKNEEYDRELSSALSALTLQSFRTLLFSTDGEEHDATGSGSGAYEVPNFGKFVYCGLQGINSVLTQIRVHNDLGHPICQNLRDGCWMIDYVHGRLRRFAELNKVADVFERSLSVLSSIPYYLRPCYFEAVVQHLYTAARTELQKKMNPALRDASSFVRSLLLSTVSFVGYVPGAGLSAIPDSIPLEDPFPSSLSAGLPHFATGIWRNWGRDTFIALPGCLLLPGRYHDARNIIISFAGSMRHGLIPNLLAEGKGARYNCRDAVWFWLYAIVRYVELAPKGIEILNCPVKRIYANDDSQYMEEEREEKLVVTVVEALQRHFAGISFRERNAGSQIDEHMRSEGFDLSVSVDPETGFIHGGNEWNCGTWMDKMGSSEKANNRGFPATPRDGAAVELQALAYTVLRNMEKWREQGKVETAGVKKGDLSWSWKQWADKIQANFESKFYVDEDSTEEFVNRKGIVKDTVGSHHKFTDFQLRPNFTIALATAPDLVAPAKAWRALENAREILLGPIGIKTLDPSDWAYHGFYNNEDDGMDRKTAKGWNYHQGPEWVWVAAFYLKARIAIGQKLGGEHWQAARKEVESRLGVLQQSLASSPWRSLPELTQEGGATCPGSCPAQAWSVGCILEACCSLTEKLNQQSL